MWEPVVYRETFKCLGMANPIKNLWHELLYTDTTHQTLMELMQFLQRHQKNVQLYLEQKVVLQSTDFRRVRGWKFIC